MRTRPLIIIIAFDRNTANALYPREFLKDMKKKTKKAVVKPEPGFYKGYDIRWLKGEPSHPDFELVAEFEAKQKGK